MQDRNALRDRGKAMPLPNDRRSLRRLEAETERIVDDLRSHGDQSLGRYSRELGKLGEIRAQLGRPDEAETLYDEAARVASTLDETSDIEFAAVARIRQASLAMAAGRHRYALAVVEDMVASLGGFPRLEGVPGGAAPGLQLWMALLHEVGDTQRLYEASGVAMELLSPPASRAMGITLLQAYVFRGRGAKALGHADEAIEMYMRAIAQADMVRPPLTDDAMLESAILSLPGLLEEVGRDDDLPAAYAQIVSGLASSKSFTSRTAVRAARAWLRADSRG